MSISIWKGLTATLIVKTKNKIGVFYISKQNWFEETWEKTQL